MMGSMKGTAISRPKRMIQLISTHIGDGWLVINNQSDFMKIIVFLVD